MDFFSINEIETSLPFTRYKNPTNIQPMENGGIGLVQQLPLGKLVTSFISPGAIFLGTLAAADIFYNSQVLAIAPLATVENLNRRLRSLEDTCQKLVDQNIELNKQLQSKSQLTDAVKALEGELGEMKSRLSRSSTENINLSAEIEVHKISCRSLQVKLDQATGSHQERINQLSEAFKKENQSLLTQLTNSFATTESLKAKISFQKSQIDEFSQKLVFVAQPETPKEAEVIASPPPNTHTNILKRFKLQEIPQDYTGKVDQEKIELEASRNSLAESLKEINTLRQQISGQELQINQLKEQLLLSPQSVIPQDVEPITFTQTSDTRTSILRRFK